MKRILFLVVGLMISLATSAQVASRTQYGVLKLGNNMADSAGAVKILFPVSLSSTAIKAMFNGTNGIGYDGNGLFYLTLPYLNTAIENWHKNLDGWDADASTTKVLSRTNGIMKWIVASTSTGGTSSTTVTGFTPRDTIAFYADSTKNRFVSTGTSSVTLTTLAQINSFLTTTQNNVDATVANGTYVNTNDFAQTGAWTNVRLKAQTNGGVIFQRDNYSTVFIFNNTHSVNSICIQGIKFLSTYNNTSGVSNPIFWNTELVTMNGAEIVDCEITSNSNGIYNGYTMSQYSTSSSSGATAKNIFFHRNYVHHVGRANEVLSQGYDYPRIIGFVATNNRFENMGINDQHGFGLSLSGNIKGVLEKGNKFVNCKNIGQEIVNVQYALLTANTHTNSTTNVVTGIGISDDGVNSTKYIYFEYNNIQTTGRGWYAYDAKYIYGSNNTVLCNQGIDNTADYSEFRNNNVTVWNKNAQSYAWQLDVNGEYVIVDGNTVSNANSVANGSIYVHEVITVKGNNKTVTNNTLTQGKQPDGTYFNNGNNVLAVTANATGNVLSPNTIQYGN